MMKDGSDTARTCEFVIFPLLPPPQQHFRPVRKGHKAILLGSSNPVVQKQTKVKGFHIEQWKSVAPKILKQAVLLKFGQNQVSKQKLLMTRTK